MVSIAGLDCQRRPELHRPDRPLVMGILHVRRLCTAQCDAPGPYDGTGYGHGMSEMISVRLAEEARRALAELEAAAAEVAAMMVDLRAPW